MIPQSQILEWFHGIDVFIDIFSMIVILLITLKISKFYLMKRRDSNQIKINSKNKISDNIFPKNKNKFLDNTGEKRYKLFIIAFLLLSLSFIAKLFTYIVIEYKAIETKTIGFLTISYQIVKTSEVPIFIGLFIFRILSLLAFYLLYLAYTRKDMKIDINNPGKSGITLRNSLGMILVIYLLLIAGYFSQSVYYIYYTTCFFMLFLITESIYEIYSVNKNKNTLLLAISFGIIMLSHAVFIFLNIHCIAYISAEIIQLLGYFLLLITFSKITWINKKKINFKVKNNESKKKRKN